MTRLFIAAEAQSDIDWILHYLEREAGTRTAAAYADRFAETIERLTQFPRSGAPRPVLGAHARITVVLPYVLIYDYDTDEDVVHVLRVLHGKRDITTRLLPR